MASDWLILAYVGPETILPATSALAAAGGVLLLFGRRIVQLFKWTLARVTGRQPTACPTGEHEEPAESALP